MSITFKYMKKPSTMVYKGGKEDQQAPVWLRCGSKLGRKFAGGNFGSSNHRSRDLLTFAHVYQEMPSILSSLSILSALRSRMGTSGLYLKSTVQCD